MQIDTRAISLLVQKWCFMLGTWFLKIIFSKNHYLLPELVLDLMIFKFFIYTKKGDNLSFNKKKQIQKKNPNAITVLKKDYFFRNYY